MPRIAHNDAPPKRDVGSSSANLGNRDLADFVRVKYLPG
jgi:hypothetical protein